MFLGLLCNLYKLHPQLTAGMTEILAACTNRKCSFPAFSKVNGVNLKFKFHWISLCRDKESLKKLRFFFIPSHLLVITWAHLSTLERWRLLTAKTMKITDLSYILRKSLLILLFINIFALYIIFCSCQAFCRYFWRVFNNYNTMSDRQLLKYAK